MTTRQTKAELLEANRQLQDRIETLEEVLSALYGKEMDTADLKGLATEAEAKSRLALIVESSDDAIFSHTIEGIVESWNPAAERLFGYTAEEMIGHDFREKLIPPEDFSDVLKNIDGIWHGKRVDHVEAERLRKDGSRVMVSVVASPVRNAAGRIISASVNMRDISKRKIAEEKSMVFRALLDKAGDGILVVDQITLSILDVNEAACRMHGHSREEMLAIRVSDLDPDVSKETLIEVNKQLQEEHSSSLESVHRRKDGTTFPVEINISVVRVADRDYRVAILRDISERKQSEESLRLFRNLLDNSGDAIEVIDPETMRLQDVNETECRALGYSREELLTMGIDDIDVPPHPERDERLRQEVLRSGGARFESMHRRKDGSTFPVEVNVKLLHLDKPYLLSIARDITERKQTEAVLARANRTLRMISACNLALVRAENERELMQKVTDTIVNMGGYDLAVVDHAEDDPGKTLTPIAWTGYEKREYWAKRLSWGDTKHGQLPVSKAVRSCKTQICRDIVHPDSGFAPWRKAVKALGYVANIALPLICEGRACGGLSIYSSRENAFDEDEVRFLEELADDLSYGMTALRIRAEHAQHEVILRRALERSIQTIADTVAARDPYTAGHQHSVDRLSIAIAREMGLSEEQIDAIHFAAMVHDLGKIHIPAEILTKPSRLTDVEYMLMQTHPQAGYDILKGVEFPWPIAEIILQHHERIDGSGYPQGLKGKDILLEARVIAVADVVDAMSSHRPYRPGLGVERALEEVKVNRGVRYDPKVVDACLKVFRKGYKLTHWSGISKKEKNVTILSQRRAKPKSQSRSSRRVTK